MTQTEQSVFEAKASGDGVVDLWMPRRYLQRVGGDGHGFLLSVRESRALADALNRAADEEDSRS